MESLENQKERSLLSNSSESLIELLIGQVKMLGRAEALGLDPGSDGMRSIHESLELSKKEILRRMEERERIAAGLG